MPDSFSARVSSRRRPRTYLIPRLLQDGALLGILVFVLVPLLYAFLTSLKSGPAEILGSNPSLLPQRWSFENYIYVPFYYFFASSMFTNSLIVCGLTTAIAITFAALSAYALARFRFPGDDFYMVGLAGTQFIPSAALFIPLFMTFLWMRRTLGIPLEGRLATIIVYVGLSMPLAVWILRWFFKSIPVDLEEQALVDGATRLYAFRRVVLPLAMPGIFATAVYIFMVAWDEMFFGSVLNAGTVAASLRAQLGFGDTPFAALIALLTTIPIAAMFFTLQKRFIGDLTGVVPSPAQEAKADTDRWWRVASVVFPVLAAALFVFRTTHESLWMDEAFTMGLTNHSPADIWRLTSADVHPPLYYFMLWAFRSVFGNSILVARLFSALGALCTVLLGLGPIRRAAGQKVAVLYMGLAMVMPAYIAYAQDIRMYTWAAFFVTGMAVYTYLAIQENKRADWVKLGCFAVGAMYAHLYSLMAAFFIGLFALLYVVMRNRGRLPSFLATMGVASVLFLPWIFNLLRQAAQAARSFWIPPVTRGVVVDTLALPFGFKFFGTPLATSAAMLVYSVVLLGIITGLRKRDSVGLPLLCATVFGATLGAAILISYLVRPLLVSRYMLPLVGLLLLGLAYGLSRLSTSTARAVCAILVLAAIPTLVIIYQDRFNGPMTEVVEYLQDNMGADDIFLHTDEHTLHTFAYYFPDHLQVMYLRPEPEVYSVLEVHDNVRVTSNLHEALTGGRRVWLVARTQGGNREAYEEAATELGLTPIPLTSFNTTNPSGADFGTARFFGLGWSWYTVILDQTYLAHW